jgi:hypothetical protein
MGAGTQLQVEAGIDPRAVQRAEKARNEMTVAKAHGLYMVAVHEGRSSRAKRINKPRTIKDKMDVYNHDIAPTLGSRNIYEVTERDLINLVEAKGKTAKVRANRLAAELKVFFGWAASLRGLEVGLEADPSKRLGDLRFPEKHGRANSAISNSSGSFRRWSRRSVIFSEACYFASCQRRALPRWPEPEATRSSMACGPFRQRGPRTPSNTASPLALGAVP